MDLWVCVFALSFSDHLKLTLFIVDPLFFFSSSSLVTHSLTFVLRLIALRSLRVSSPPVIGMSQTAPLRTQTEPSQPRNADHSFRMYNMCIMQTADLHRRQWCVVPDTKKVDLICAVIWPEMEIVNIVRHLACHLQSIWLGMINVPE